MIEDTFSDLKLFATQTNKNLLSLQEDSGMDNTPLKLLKSQLLFVSGGDMGDVEIEPGVGSLSPSIASPGSHSPVQLEKFIAKSNQSAKKMIKQRSKLIGDTIIVTDNAAVDLQM